MLKPGTTFVLGAGASADVRMPMGSVLAEDIRSFLTVKEGRVANRDINLALNRFGPHQRSEYLEAARVISNGIWGAHSIDDFMFTHNQNDRGAELGKLAIAYSILMPIQKGTAEGPRKIFFTSHGMSKADQEAVGKTLHNFLCSPWVQDPIISDESNCFEFFAQYQRSLG